MSGAKFFSDLRAEVEQRVGAHRKHVGLAKDRDAAAYERGAADALDWFRGELLRVEADVLSAERRLANYAAVNAAMKGGRT